ncbi:unnamed protein product [Nyctereutes procyonoides]|uniref:(raccoon dog) hypothetical protein n=1 Tax=Nyctereutes procyonoides TaxID=34880 RepID=A0A811ZGK1_NYCPR|nr:unnamed protein product [Nyctereutes procyonoides]
MGFTFLMPAVSAGNVGQHTIDLIISTLDMCKIVYSLPSKKLVALQLRSIFIKNGKKIHEIDDSKFCIYIPGRNIIKTLYEECCSKEISVAVLLKFVSEGGNIPDALDLVTYLNEWLQISKPCWKMPHSCRLLFGNGLSPVLFKFF